MAIQRATTPRKPSTRVERAHWSAGRSVVVGADAVGVACLSGPVIAAAVAMRPLARRIPGVRDSKMLSRAQRERLYPFIRRRALAVGLGAASVTEIDRLNIYHATNLAMRRAICRIGDRDHVLIDGLRVRAFEQSVGPYTAIVHGDAACYSIAAASIVAKVVRDRLMDRLARRHPHYGWDHNAGYATLDHRRGIEEHGITAFHRRSFARVRAAALGEQLELDLDGIGLADLESVDLGTLEALEERPATLATA
jgi:ribonuclease HII